MSITTITYNEQRTVVQSVAVVGYSESGSVSLQCAEQINAFSVVTSNDAGELIKADATTARFLLGMVKNAGNIGDLIQVYSSGEIVNVGWNLIPNAVVYLGSNGDITQTAPDVTNHFVVGLAVSPTRIVLQLQPVIVRL